VAAVVIALVVSLAALFTGGGFVGSFRLLNTIIVIAAVRAFTACG